MSYFHGPACPCVDCSLKRMDSTKLSWRNRRDAWRTRETNELSFRPWPWIGLGVGVIVVVMILASILFS